MQTAVLVIDVQRALCEGPEEGFDWTGVVERINGLARRAREVGAPVIFVQHETAAGPFQFESEGWRLARGLDVRADDPRLRKTTPDSFLRTGLEELLRQRGVERLVVCGMQTEFCVDTTTRRALALGFPVILAADGHTTPGNPVLSARQIIEHHNFTLANMSSFGPRATPTPCAEIDFTA